MFQQQPRQVVCHHVTSQACLADMVESWSMPLEITLADLSTAAKRLNTKEKEKHLLHYGLSVGDVSEHHALDDAGSCGTPGECCTWWLGMGRPPAATHGSQSPPGKPVAWDPSEACGLSD
ncbi:hypothetical protein FQN60_017371 [Etheostoma spectabile]|uniref:Uncharacterized protein n=1 Tax=Etheostoma spectabile TaxID=54343 RepID=A0A5J5DFB8_9PERO|nr:hypothetical protein FQN60_007341 [Etheostoma spectabile]KAA8591997.1 hypothetical protein FQN60_017371 [Etheostoma spectabile]